MEKERELGNLGVVSIKVICVEAMGGGEITHGKSVEYEIMYIKVFFKL